MAEILAAGLMWGCGRVHSWIGGRTLWVGDRFCLRWQHRLVEGLPLLVNAPVRSGVGGQCPAARSLAARRSARSRSASARFALGFSACVLCLPPALARPRARSSPVGMIMPSRSHQRSQVSPRSPDTPRATASRPGRCRRTMSHPCAPAGHARARKRATARPPSAALGHTRCSAQTFIPPVDA
jgi:hypothetical protein